MADRKVCLKCGQEGHTSSSCKKHRHENVDARKAGPAAVSADRWQRLLAYLQTQGRQGKSTAAIRTDVFPGLNTDGLKKWLDKQRKEGALCASHAGAAFVWHLPEDTPAVRQMLAEHALRSEELARQRKRAADAARAASAKDKHESWANKPFDRVLINADDAAPIGLPGVRSVFELWAAS